MSFQKAHNISNELGEVVAQADVNLNAVAITTLLPINPAFKNYRILEIGWVCTNNTGSAALQFNVGTTSGGVELIAPTAAFTIPANSFGTTFSTNTDFAFDPAGAALDADGIPRLTAGQQIFFDVSVAAGGTATGIVFARLAPEINREV